MSFKHSHITNFLKQLPFLLVLCAMFLQPIAKTFSIFSDTSIELVDSSDMEDDTEEEVEDTIEKDSKIKPRWISFTLPHRNSNNIVANDFLQFSDWSYNLDILIPPPEHS